MVATPIASSTRYINPATTKIYFVSSIANKNSPTRTELNLGTDLSGEVNAIDGWKTSSDQVETPDMATRFTSKIPGRISADDSSITFYCDKAGADARALLPRDTNGFIVILDGGDVGTQKMDVYPVRVSALGKERSTEGKDAATVEIQFSITSQPAEDVTIP
jgi:hypothetical protein